jgi:PTH1 family peptidyl-tRNA hydrolase
MSDRYLIVGLGNPGKQYEDTRHNVGWFVLDELARRHQLRFDKSEKKALTASGTIAGKRVLLAKPQTYMNLSGESVRGLVDFYKIDLPQFLVISDDLDIPFGTLRLRKTGSAGGQGGLKNIIQHLGTTDFSRIRFGIGRPPGRMNPKDYVLQAFQGDDRILAAEIASRAADAVELWLREGIEAAMTRYNGDVQKTPPEPPSDPQADLAAALRIQELNPRDTGPIEKVIGALKRLGRIDEAADWHLRAAELLRAQGKTGPAISEMEKAASLKPERLELHRQIVQAYLDSGNTRRAVQRLLILAGALEHSGQPTAALTAVEEALALNPQHPKALEMLARLRESITD